MPKNISSETSVEDEIASLKYRRDRAAHLLKLFNDYMTFRVADVPEVFWLDAAVTSPIEGPPFFTRMWNEDSRSQFSDSLGFQCSDWKNVTPAASFDEFKMHGDEMRQSLTNHLETKKSSRWISVWGSMEDVLHRAYYPEYSRANCQVAIISVPKLNRLGILWQSSDDLTEDVGLEEAANAWWAHVLVYGWIPAQCVIRVFPFDHFQSLCTERGIRSECSESIRMCKTDRLSRRSCCSKTSRPASEKE
ncbi:hypothetical protein EDD37DRAFT_331316 [Exophiala viscosa]|uniref:uncharacterized protein n=1 Tax=Exophiala viscosa TaxID=2486360 RepID=UPI00219958B7|nr:hypothetical protein EDD37DRAFT_331316 [Exophiala viscosa]